MHMEPDLIFALFMQIWTTAGLRRKLFKMCKKKPAWKMQRMKARDDYCTHFDYCDSIAIVETPLQQYCDSGDTIAILLRQ